MAPSTRSSLAKKRIDNFRFLPTKKARINIMKQLARNFVKKKPNKKHSQYFINFYNETKLIYDWLNKETLRWHILEQEKTMIRPPTSPESTTVTTYKTTDSDCSEQVSLLITCSNEQRS